MPMPRILPYGGNEFYGGEFDDEDEDELEDERQQPQITNDFDMPKEQRRVQINNLKAKKEVTFDAQIDADAANQLQIENRQAGSSVNRVTRSRSPSKRTSEEALRTAQRNTARRPSPAPSRQNPEGRGKASLGYSGTADLTPPENLTPQERKDNNLDAEVMSKLAGIRKRITEFCNDVFRKDLLPKDVTESKLKQWLAEVDQHTEAGFISFCRAVGEGGGGVETWKEVVANGECRFGLSYGIIHKVLVRHVFSSLLFGAPADLLVKLEHLEQHQENDDGFYREEHRAEHITSYELQYRMDLNECYERKEATLKTALQIWMLLEPLARLDSRSKDVRSDHELQQDLITIVATAAWLATLMRKSGKTVLYQFGNVFKEEPLDRKTMDILNIEQLKAEKGESQEAEQALIRMVCGDSLWAFRKGGGVMAERILEKEEKEQDMSVAPELRYMPRNQYRGRLITAQDGYRAKFLAKAQVVGRLQQIGSQNEAKELMEAIRALQDGGCMLQ